MIIYKCTNLVDGKIYIGKSIHELKDRVFSHKRDYLYSKKVGQELIPLYQAFDEFGFENFKWEVIEEVSDKVLLDQKEKYWIKKLNSFFLSGSGYNVNPGGSGGDNYKENPRMNEIRSKISKGVRESDRWTEEKKAALSERLKGDKNPMRINPQNSFFSKDNPMKKEFYKDQFRGDKNPMKNPSVRKRHLEAVRSEEHRRILSQKLKGKKKSVPVSEEHKRNLSIAKSLRHWYVEYDEQGDLIRIIEFGFEMDPELKKRLLNVWASPVKQTRLNNHKWKRFLKDEITKEEILLSYRKCL